MNIEFGVSEVQAHEKETFARERRNVTLCFMCRCYCTSVSSIQNDPGTKNPFWYGYIGTTITSQQQLILNCNPNSKESNAKT